MVMVDDIVSYDGDTAIFSFTVKPDNIFVDNGQLAAIALIENMAQSCAARLGLSQSPKLGVIGALNNINILHLPSVGDTIHTHIHITNEVFNMMVVEASSYIVNKDTTKPISNGILKIALL